MLIHHLLKYTNIVITLVIIFTSSTILAQEKPLQNSINFQEIKKYANLSSAVYQTLEQLKNNNTLKNYTFTQHGNISDIEIFYLLATDEVTKTQDIVVRGTSNYENTIVNVSLKLIFDKHSGVRLHTGFLQAAQAIYAEIKPQIKTGYTINTTGHSMGGAVALILAMYLDSDNVKIGQIITFGQPKVTNIIGANKFQHLKVTRVVTPKDLVPLVPLIDPMDINDLDIYWHLGKEIILLSGTTYAVLKEVNSMLRATKFTQELLTENNFKNHQMVQYLSMLNNKIPTAELVPFKNSLNLFNLFGTNNNDPDK